MTTDLASRRPIRKVMHADFAVYRVWEWALGEAEGFGSEQAFVRPTALEAIPVDTDGHYIVLATVSLSEGTAVPGCIEVTLRGGKFIAEPMCILLQERQLGFAGDEALRALSHYTKTAGVHPTGWELAVPLLGDARPRRGKLRRGLFASIGQLFLRSRATKLTTPRHTPN